MKKLALFILFAAASAFAQVPNPSIVAVSSAPSGSCSGVLPAQILISTGVIYTCQAGTWGAGTSSGGFAIPQQLCHFTTATSISTGTSQVVLQSCTIAANTLGNNARLAIHATFAGGAADTGSCTVGIKFDIVNTISAANVIFDTATGASVVTTLNANITERNATNSQIMDSWGARNTTFVSPIPNTTGAFSTAVPMYVVLVGQPGSSGDVCTLNEADVVLWPF